MSISITAKSVNEAFIKIAEKLYNNPEHISSPRSWETREALGAFIVINNPYDRLVNNVHRKISLKYLIGEWLWDERGSNSLSEINYYAKFWNSISDDKKTANSAYGHRILGINKFVIVNQWKWVKQQIIKDKETRRAVIFIGLPSDMKNKTKDFPCTISLQFLIRDNRLHLICNMRSNDLVLGFTYDVATVTLYQEKMLLELRKYYPKLNMGKYFHVAGSLHIYKKHYEMIKQIINDQDNNLRITMPRMGSLKEIKKLQYNESIIRENKNKKLKNLNDRFCIWCQNILLNKMKH